MMINPADLAKPAKLRLACLPFCGGAASIYHSWRDELGPDIAVVPFQWPGREGLMQLKPFQDLHALADWCVEQLGSLLDVPTVFYGHSMGSMVAFEVIRRLVDRQADHVAGLIVGSCAAPHEPTAAIDLDGVADSDLMNALGNRYGRYLTRAEENELAPILPIIAPVIRADMQAIGGYGLDAPVELPLPITAIMSPSDPSVSVSGAQAWSAYSSDFRFERIAGGHFFLRHEADALFALIRNVVSVGVD